MPALEIPIPVDPAAGSPTPERIAQRNTLRRARIAASTYFFLVGAITATWTARIPAVKDHLKLGDGTLSIALLAVAAGAVLAMRVAGSLVDRLGAVRVVCPAGVLLCVSLVGPALSGDLATLCGTLFVFGAAHGLVDVAMNVNATHLQHAVRRPIMTSIHAAFSIGGLCGAVLGGLTAHAGISPTMTFAALAVPSAALMLANSRRLLPDPEHEATPESSSPADPAPATRWSGRVALLGALALFCLLGEGAMADWSAVYLNDDLGTSHSVAAYGYAAFSIAMAVGRLVGDRLTARLGPAYLVRVCGLLAGCGLAAGLLTGRTWAAIAGFGLFGLGLSAIVPTIFTAVANRGPHTGRDLARVSSLGYLGFLVGPAAIGAVAHLTGLRTALALPAVLAVLIAFAAPVLHTSPRRHSHDPDIDTGTALVRRPAEQVASGS